MELVLLNPMNTSEASSYEATGYQRSLFLQAIGYQWSFFLEEPPVCSGYDKRLTLEHILLTCSDFIEIRESHFTAKSLRMLFKDISPQKIFNFLKEINIFGFFFLNLRSVLVMFVFSPFKHGFKTVYRLILRHTHY